MSDPKALYLDLMKKCLTYYLWGETTAPFDMTVAHPLINKLFVRPVVNLLQKFGMQIIRELPYDPVKRAEGRDWPPLADTMIGLKRLDNLQFCVESVIKNNIPGDVIETGVWRGGGSIFMRAVLGVHGVTDKTVWVADSFQGLPPPDVEKYPQDKGDIHHEIRFLAVSCEQVKANFTKYGLLDDQVRFLEGWFKDTLPTAPIDKLSVIRLDGDMYESTMDGFNNLYPKLSVGGYVIVDDYVLTGCRKAVHDYRVAHAITEEIIDIDGTGAYWQRKK